MAKNDLTLEEFLGFVGEQAKGAGASFVSLFPYALGWIAGACVRFYKWAKALIRVGYLDGAGDETWLEYQKKLGDW